MISSAFKFGTELLISVRALLCWIFRKERTFKEELIVADKVDESLNKLMKDTGADRAYVFQFHNGTLFYTGAHILKMSNTNEVALKGISREQLNHQNIITDPYRFLINGLFDKEVNECVNTEELEDFNCSILMDNRGVKSFALRLMMDKNKRALGFVGIDFVKDNKELDDQSRLSLKQATNSICNILIYGKSKEEKK